MVKSRFRTIGAIAGAAALGALAVLSPASPVSASTPTAWSVSLTPASTVSTVQITTSFTGLFPNSAIQIKLMPVAIVVADDFSSAQGEASFTFGVPSNLQPGSYTISAAGITSTDSAFTADVAAFEVGASGSVTDSTLRDGVLSLNVPASAAATFGEPYLDGNISVTDGTLGQFSVTDERVVSRRGWILYASVSDFRLSTDTNVVLPANQLGVSPAQFIPGSTAEGIVLGIPTRAGLASYPMIFAEATPGASPGTTVLDANLKLLSPPYLPVGTYTSTVTLTLVSK
jgi:hypothetical protein